MKQHSYAFYTGWLSNVYFRRERLKAELKNIVSEQRHLALDKGLTDEGLAVVEEKLRLVQEIENAERDLTGKTFGKVKYPNNLTYSNFAEFMFCPTLVYELEYPRTDRYPSFPA